MKLIAPFIALCAIFYPLGAHAANCRDIPTAKERLACHDKQAPISNIQERKAEKTADGKDDMIEPNKFLDEEEARMKKALMPICQHC